MDQVVPNPIGKPTSNRPVPPTMYIPVPQHQEPPSSMSISVRAAGGSPALLTRSVAVALTSVNGDIAVTLRPLEDQVRAALTRTSGGDHVRVLRRARAAAIGAAAMVLLAVGGRADGIPARRAARLDPASVLRES